MKITELDGLIKIEADKDKVLTTLDPSSLRTKLIYLGIEDSVDNYTEVDEEPEIELPFYEEPNITEPEEILNGYTLVEAYHYLLNDNKILKEENKKQGELINEIMTTVNEMFIMIEPLLCK